MGNIAPSILIIQELPELPKDGSIACEAYKIILKALGYESWLCHSAGELAETLDVFKPDIIFWLYPRSNNIGGMLWKIRQNSKKVKVIWATEGPVGRPFSFEDMSKFRDHDFNSIVITGEEFQKIVTEWFIDSLDNELDTETWQSFLSLLTPKAQKLVVAEQMWPWEKSRLKVRLEWEQRGHLNEYDQVTLRQLLDTREQLLQRKKLAASILIEQGYSDSIEELIAESNRLDLQWP